MMGPWVEWNSARVCFFVCKTEYMCGTLFALTQSLLALEVIIKLSFDESSQNIPTKNNQNSTKILYS